MAAYPITLGSLHANMRRIQQELNELKSLVHSDHHATGDKVSKPLALVDESLLAECWASEEDEAAFAYLQ